MDPSPSSSPRGSAGRGDTSDLGGLTHDQLCQRLGAFIAREAAAASVTIENLRRLPGGASRETWSLDATYVQDGAEVRLPLILRSDPSATAVQTSRRDEFLLLKTAHAAGVPVPRVFWLADETDTLGARFLLMERIDGETLARRLLRDAEYETARRVMTSQLGEILARIHSIDTRSLSFLPQPPEGETPARAEVERYEQLFRLAAPEPHPAFEIAFRWLRGSMPAARQMTVVHGDYRVGNVMFGAEGVRAILDWELAHVGDPMEDLGWLCVRSWRFGSDDKPAGGIGTREELFAAYERASGHPVDPERVRFWEVFGNLKWGTICISQARSYLEGASRSVELAALGRRTAEVEIELLNLIEEREE